MGVLRHGGRQRTLGLDGAHHRGSERHALPRVLREHAARPCRGQPHGVALYQRRACVLGNLHDHLRAELGRRLPLPLAGGDSAGKPRGALPGSLHRRLPGSPRRPALHLVQHRLQGRRRARRHVLLPGTMGARPYGAQVQLPRRPLRLRLRGRLRRPAAPLAGRLGLDPVVLERVLHRRAGRDPNDPGEPRLPRARREQPVRRRRHGRAPHRAIPLAGRPLVPHAAALQRLGCWHDPRRPVDLRPGNRDVDPAVLLRHEHPGCHAGSAQLLLPRELRPLHLRRGAHHGSRKHPGHPD